MTISYVRAFARHETFHPRYGWLRKAVRAAGANPACFLESDATVRLGVGKNMVRAIRYWGLAYGLLEETAIPARPRLMGAKPTRLAEFLMGKDATDAYLENPTSLWLLHWQLLREGSMAPTWYMTFNRFPQREFSDGELTTWLQRELALDGVADLALSSVEKDVSCLLRMYGSPSASALTTTLASPFSALRLVDQLGSPSHRYRITYGPKAGLAPELVVIVALEAMFGSAPEARSIGLAALATGAHGPGRAFGLAEDEIADAIGRAALRVPGFELSMHAGARHLAVAREPLELSGDLFRSIYEVPDRRFDLADLTKLESAAA
jgi:hypothetical protein